jgi:hypothetical protein
MIMFRCLTVVIALLASRSLAQVGDGTIVGSVSDPDGHAVSRFPVHAVNSRTNAGFTATPSERGEYKLGPLPAGTYTIQIDTPRILFLPFSRENVNVVAGQTSKLDIQLGEGLALNTAGDGRDFSSDRAKRAVPTLVGPAPRTSYGKPDLSGLWSGDSIVDAGKPEMLPTALTIWKERIDNNLRDLPSGSCLPLGIIMANMFGLHRIVQAPDLIVILYEGDIPGYRQIPIDGRKLVEGLDPTWMGRSAAHWDGDTLVVESAGFNDKTWLDADGHPHTERMRVTERIRRTDLGHLETELTIDDPGAYLRPWTSRKVSSLAAPGEEMLESICTENNRDVVHMVGK